MELELTLDNFDAEIGKSTPILVDFWAAWCGPCRMLSGVIQQLANDSDGSYRVGKVNVDEQPELAKRFGIASIPTVILFRNGEPGWFFDSAEWAERRRGGNRASAHFVF